MARSTLGALWRHLSGIPGGIPMPAVPARKTLRATPAQKAAVSRRIAKLSTQSYEAKRRGDLDAAQKAMRKIETERQKLRRKNERGPFTRGR